MAAALGGGHGCVGVGGDSSGVLQIRATFARIWAAVARAGRGGCEDSVAVAMAAGGKVVLVPAMASVADTAVAAVAGGSMWRRGRGRAAEKEEIGKGCGRGVDDLKLTTVTASEGTDGHGRQAGGHGRRPHWPAW